MGTTTTMRTRSEGQVGEGEAGEEDDIHWMWISSNNLRQLWLFHFFKYIPELYQKIIPKAAA